jgi:hypothetical protein
MTVTVSPIRAPQLISEPSPFSRYLGRFIGPTAPAQVATLAFPLGPDPDGLVVVYEGQIDNDGTKAVFARIISSSGALLPEITVATGAETASVASLPSEQIENYRDRFVVVFRSHLPKGDILAQFHRNDGISFYDIWIAEGSPPPLVPTLWQLAPSIAIKGPAYHDRSLTVVWSSGYERRAADGEPLDSSFTSTCVYDTYQLGVGPRGPSGICGTFDATSRSNPKFNACAQVAPIVLHYVARVYQTDSGEIHVGVRKSYGTSILGSAYVGLGDYPTITSLSIDNATYNKMAVVAWHDPVSSDIKFRFVWVDGSENSPSPVTVQDEVLANVYKSSRSGRPAVAVLYKNLFIDYRHPAEQAFVIVWENSVGQITARVFNLLGRPSTPEIIISDSPGQAPSVIATPSGFFVVWMESPDTAIIMGRPYQVTIT